MHRHLLLGALLLTGCAHAAPTAQVRLAATTQAQAKDCVFPCDTGHTWQYAVVAHPQDDPDANLPGSQTVKVEATRRDGKCTQITLRDIDSYTEEYRFLELRCDDSGLAIAGATYFGPGAQKADDLQFQLLGFPLAEGKRWDDGQWSGHVEAHESVTTAAGTFDAYKVEGIGTYEEAYTCVGDYWFTPGVGIVKSRLTIPGYYVDTELAPAGARLPHGPKLTLPRPKQGLKLQKRG